jgi:transposase
MLKHGRTYPRKKGWTMRYLRWLQEQQFDHPAHQIALQEMVEAVRVARERVERLERTIEEFVSAWSLEPLVRALQTLRGIDLIVAVTFATEVGDVSRFESPRQLMGYLGLVPGERSTGETGRRGGITKAGNGRVRHMLVESAWTSTPAEDRQDKAIPARAGIARRARDCVESTEPLDGLLQEAGCVRQVNDGGLHCYRS